MTREIEAILDECLDRIQAQGLSVEECLASYPEAAEELRALLSLASDLQQSLGPTNPRPDFVASSSTRMANRLRARASRRHSQKPEPRRPAHRWLPRPAYALASLALVLALLGSGVGVVAASASSLPGDALYGVKRAGEQVRLALSITPEGDQALLLSFADERLEEAELLIDAGRLEDLGGALEGFEQVLEQLEAVGAELGEPGLGSLEAVQARLAHHIQVLERVRSKVPQQAQQAIERAIERSNQSRENLQKGRDKDHPNPSAPGQVKKETPGENRGQGQDRTPKPSKTPKPKKIPGRPDWPTQTSEG